MNAVYPAVYRDALGEEQTVIENDGQTLRMVVRDVEFISPPFGSFDGLMPQDREQALQAGFTLDRYNQLLAGTVVFDAPVTVVVDGVAATGTLTVQIDLEGAGLNAAEREWADPRLALAFNGSRILSRGGGGSFEGELLQIQRQLPAGAHFRCCFGCAFSGYNPYGSGLWGMYCHRNHKEAYVQANDKFTWIRLNEDAAEYVQEIYLCPEFQRWNGETGYRDPLPLTVIN